MDLIKDDIYIIITASAKSKMPFLFIDEDENETYYNEGRKYQKWDVPIFLSLYGTAHNWPSYLIYGECIKQMTSHKFSPDAAKLNKILETVQKGCQKEIDAIIETERRYSAHEDPLQILKDIKSYL